MSVLVFCLSVILSPASRDSLLAHTPGNEAVWVKALTTLDGQELSCAEYLFETIPRLDRLEMTEEALMDHILGALSNRCRFYGEGTLPDSLFLSCVLLYRVDQEPVTGYRKQLAEYWNGRLPHGEVDPFEVALIVAEAIHSRTEVIAQGYLGGIEPPLVSLAAGKATPAECTVLLCSSLKALGIASRQVDGWFSGEGGVRRRWLEIRLRGGGWEPLTLPWEPVPEGFEGLSLAVLEASGEFVTGSVVRTGLIRIEPPDEPVEGEWYGTVSTPVRGGFVPLDWMWFDPLAAHSLELGPGDYLLCVSRWKPEGGVFMRSATVRVESGSTLPFRPFH